MIAFSWRVIVSTSASDKCRRASSATLRTSSALSDMTWFRLESRHLERLAFKRAFDETGANGLHTDANGLNRAIDLDLDALKIGQEPAFGLTGNLLPHAAEVFRFA